MSDTELMLINAFIGFCTPIGGTWPSPLATLGYHAVGVETEVVSELDAQPRRVVPDVVCASEATQHTLCVEAKSATLDVPQGRAYAAMTPRNLINTGNLPPYMNPAQLTHDVLYATLYQHHESLSKQLDTVSIRLPVVAADDDEVRLVRGSLSQGDLDSLFKSGIQLTGAEWPRHFVPFTSRSSDADIAPSLIRALLQLILRGQPFSETEIDSMAVRHWDLCGQDERNRLRRKIRDVLALAESEELKGYFKRSMPHLKWEVLKPNQHHPNQLAKLQDLATAFVYRTEQGIPFKLGQPLLIRPEHLDPDS